MSEEKLKKLFRTKHVCQKNHDSTAGSMKPQGMLRIFERSAQKYQLQYTKYLGDGDSKSYKMVADPDI